MVDVYTRAVDPAFCGGSAYTQREHKFTNWESQEEGGLLVYMRGKRTGHVEYFSREWQTRTCEICGFVQSTDVRTT